MHTACIYVDVEKSEGDAGDGELGRATQSDVGGLCSALYNFVTLYPLTFVPVLGRWLPKYDPRENVTVVWWGNRRAATSATGTWEHASANQEGGIDY